MDADLDGVDLDGLMEAVGPWDANDVSPAEADKLLGSAGAEVGMANGDAVAGNIDIDDVDWEAIYAAGLDSLPPSPDRNASCHRTEYPGAVSSCDDWLPWPSPRAAAGAPPPRPYAGETPQGSDGVPTDAEAPAAIEAVPVQSCRPTWTLLLPHGPGQRQASGCDSLRPCPLSLPPDAGTCSQSSPGLAGCGSVEPSPPSLPPPPGAPQMLTGAGAFSAAISPSDTPCGAADGPTANTWPQVAHIVLKGAAAATPGAAVCDGAKGAAAVTLPAPLLVSMGSDLTTAGTAVSPASASANSGPAGVCRSMDRELSPRPLLPSSCSHSQSQATSSCISGTASAQISPHPPSERFPRIFAAPAPPPEWPLEWPPPPQLLPCGVSGRSRPTSAAPTASGSVSAGCPSPLPAHAPQALSRQLSRAAAAIAAATSMGLPPPDPTALGLPPLPHPRPKVPSASAITNGTSCGLKRNEQCLQDLLELRAPQGSGPGAASTKGACGPGALGWAVGCRCGCAKPAAQPLVLRRTAQPVVSSGPAQYRPYIHASFASGGGGSGDGGGSGWHRTAGSGRPPPHLSPVPEDAPRLDSPQFGPGCDSAGGQAPMLRNEPGNNSFVGLPPPAGCAGSAPSARHTSLGSVDLELGLSEMEEAMLGLEAAQEDLQPVQPGVAGAGMPKARLSSTGGAGDGAGAVPQWPHAGAECEVDDNEDHLLFLRSSGGGALDGSGDLRSGGDDGSGGGGGGAHGIGIGRDMHLALPSGPCTLPCRQAARYGSSSNGAVPNPHSSGFPIPYGSGHTHTPMPAQGSFQADTLTQGPHYAGPLPPPLVPSSPAPAGVLHSGGPITALRSCPCPECHAKVAPTEASIGAVGPAGTSGHMAPSPAGGSLSHAWCSRASGPGQPSPHLSLMDRAPPALAPPPGRCTLPCCNPLAPSGPAQAPPPLPGSTACAPMPVPSRPAQPPPCTLPCCNPKPGVPAEQQAPVPITVNGASIAASGSNGGGISGGGGSSTKGPGSASASGAQEAAASGAASIWEGVPLPLPEDLPSRRGRGEAGPGGRSVRPRHATPETQAYLRQLSYSYVAGSSGAGNGGGGNGGGVSTASTTSSSDSFVTQASPLYPLQPTQQQSPGQRPSAGGLGPCSGGGIGGVLQLQPPWAALAGFIMRRQRPLYRGLPFPPMAPAPAQGAAAVAVHPMHAAAAPQ